MESIPDDVLIKIATLLVKNTKLIRFFLLRSINKQWERIVTYVINKIVQIQIPKSMIFQHQTTFPFRTNHDSMSQWLPVSFYYDSNIKCETIANLMVEIADTPVKNLMSYVHCELKQSKDSKDSNECFYFLIGTKPNKDQLGYLAYFVKDLNGGQIGKVYVFSFFSKPKWYSLLDQDQYQNVFNE